jgi:hypothetical protein
LMSAVSPPPSRRSPVAWGTIRAHDLVIGPD